MKTIECLKFLKLQREAHGKVFFTVTELAKVAGASSRVMNVELSRLIRRGVMQRFTHGRYGSSDPASPMELVSALDSSAYITGFYALHLHDGTIAGIPTIVFHVSSSREAKKYSRIFHFRFFILDLRPECAQPRLRLWFERGSNCAGAVLDAQFRGSRISRPVFVEMTRGQEMRKWPASFEVSACSAKEMIGIKQCIADLRAVSPRTRSSPFITNPLPKRLRT